MVSEFGGMVERCNKDGRVRSSVFLFKYKHRTVMEFCITLVRCNQIYIRLDVFGMERLSGKHMHNVLQNESVRFDLAWFALPLALFGINHVSSESLPTALGYLIWHVDGLISLSCCSRVG